jgi:hypothetical protein
MGEEKLEEIPRRHGSRRRDRRPVEWRGWGIGVQGVVFSAVAGSDDDVRRFVPTCRSLPDAFGHTICARRSPPSTWMRRSGGRGDREAEERNRRHRWSRSY